MTSKPELYPLVLSYNMEGNKIANGSYYVVQQFRNYLINPLSSLSGASNVETLGSNLLDDTISDTNPAPPSYTMIPEIPPNVTQTDVQTSTSLLDNLAAQAIPEEGEEGEGDKRSDTTPLFPMQTRAESGPPSVFSSGPQVFAQFNASASRFNSKHKRYSSIVITPKQTLPIIPRSISAPPTPSNPLSKLTSSSSGISEHPVASTLFEHPVCNVMSENLATANSFEHTISPVQSCSNVITEQPLASSPIILDTLQDVAEYSEHPVNSSSLEVPITNTLVEHTVTHDMIVVHPVAGKVLEHSIVDL